MEPAKKKCKVDNGSGRQQTYLKSYSDKFPMVTSSAKGNTMAFCKCCKCDFSVSRSGMFDVKRHCDSVKHLNNMKSSGNSKPIGSFFKNPDNEEALFKEKVVQAEAIFVDLLAELNLPIAVSDKINIAVKTAFPNSQIAKSFQCGRTKATAVANDLADLHRQTLIKRMKSGPFTLSTDGSNDQTEKLFPIVVRTINPDNTVKSELLSLPTITGSATGEAIFRLLEDVMDSNGIPWSHCLAIGCDNASVMTGVHKGVFAFVKEKNPNVFLAGCTLHLVHIAAEKGAAMLPISPAELLTDIFYFLQKSSVRQHSLQCFQELSDVPQRKMLKHVSTRWLSIGRCLDRLLENWKPLKAFIKEEQKKTKFSSYHASKVKRIFEALPSPSSRLCCLFLRYATKMFDSFLTMNQSDAPQIHCLHQSMSRLVREVLLKYVNPAGMANRTAWTVEDTLPYNIKGNGDILIGEDARVYIANKDNNGLTDARLLEFYSNVVAYYQAIVSYMRSNLPQNDKLLIQVGICDPAQLAGEGMLSKLSLLLDRFPCLLQGSSKDTAMDQFADLQIYSQEESDAVTANRLDGQWGLILAATGDRFSVICPVLLGLLTIPHSSSHCE